MAEVYMAGDFRNGTTFEMDGNVFKVVEFQHVKPGKGSAFVRTKLKNVISGAVIEKTFNPSEKYPGAEIEKREMQYLYNDEDLYYFMDNETYEQMPLNKEQLGDSLKFIKENINDNLSINDKIKLFHDYIINNTKFDTAIENSNDRLNSTSYTAYGLLINHLAICGGYTDTMSIYLDKLNIPNYRISTEEHVWNLVNINNNWLNLDVTWDDPVTSDNSDVLIYDYYLISTDELFKKDSKQHNFNQNIYKEAI